MRQRSAQRRASEQPRDARRQRPIVVAGGPIQGRMRDLVTPEGVTIHLPLASAGDRILAFTIDVSIVLFSIAIVTVTSLLAIGGGGAPWVAGFFLLATFLVRNFYFMFFELRWRGSTPGKRLRRMRVVDAHGGQLSEDAVIVRNLTRDLELFIPLTACVAPQLIWPSAPPWIPFLAILWMLILALLPLFNRNRQRVGDLIGGTLVIVTPKMELLADLAKQETALQRHPRGTDAGDYRFSEEQLSLYGIYELQVLERVLRQPDPAVRWEMMRAVCKKIIEKISWQGGPVNEKDFLMAFYAALRSHLEHKMLLGKRREDKFDRAR